MTVCTYMVVFSFRIDEELKKAMDMHKSVNWSEIVNQAIKKVIQQEYETNKAKAVLLNEKIRKKAPHDYDSTEIIRRMRDTRYRLNKPETLN